MLSGVHKHIFFDGYDLKVNLCNPTLVVNACACFFNHHLESKPNISKEILTIVAPDSFATHPVHIITTGGDEVCQIFSAFKFLLPVLWKDCVKVASQEFKRWS